MKTARQFLAIATMIAIPAITQAANLEVNFQATIASEQHPDYAGEARYYHVSVNQFHSGIGSYAATIVGTNTPAPSFVRNFDQPVVGYKWIGGTNNSISGTTVTGGEDNRIVYTTQDTVFDGFGQSQLKFWDATSPGPDLATGGADPYSAVDDFGSTGGYRSFGGAVGTVDVSGLFAGSLYVFYGAFNTTPTVSAVLRDTDGIAPDLVIADAHLNNDNANRTEYYVAELGFETDGVYDVLEFEHLANGTDYSGNGRGLGSLLTGSETPPSELTLQVNIATGELTLLGDENGPVNINFYEITSAGDSLLTSGWNSLQDQDYEGNGPPGSGNGWEEAGGAGPQALAEGYLLDSSEFAANVGVSLGKSYNLAVNSQDLVFSYRTDIGRIIDASVEYIAVLHGDYNADGVVDGADYTVWRDSLGQSGPTLAADGNEDGVVDSQDYDVWRGNFGLTLPPPSVNGSAGVPEPSTIALFATALAFVIAQQRRRR